MRGFGERLRQRGEQFDEALSLVRRARPSFCAETDGRAAPVDCAHPETPQDRALQNRRGHRDVLDDTCGVCVFMISAS